VLFKKKQGLKAAEQETGLTATDDDDDALLR